MTFLSSCFSSDGYLISAFQDGDKVVIKAEGKYNKKNMSEHRYYFGRCPIRGLETKFIDINNWEDIFLNVRSAVMVRTISTLNPPPLRRSTVIRFGGAVVVRGCFVLEEEGEDENIIFCTVRKNIRSHNPN